jgi:hypothetical protein
MILLKVIWESILKEQDEDNIIEFPNDNFTISVFRAEKKILFTPQGHSSLPSKIRILVNMLKQNFNILRIKDKDVGSFEVEVDPREDFESIVDYIKMQAETTV